MHCSIYTHWLWINDRLLLAILRAYSRIYAFFFCLQSFKSNQHLKIGKWRKLKRGFSKQFASLNSPRSLKLCILHFWNAVRINCKRTIHARLKQYEFYENLFFCDNQHKSFQSEIHVFGATNSSNVQCFFLQQMMCKCDVEVLTLVNNKKE